MALIKDREQSEIEKRYENIINQGQGWQDDAGPFLSDCLIEIRKKVSLINMSSYKTFIIIPIAFSFMAVFMLVAGFTMFSQFKIFGGVLLGVIWLIFGPIIAWKYIGTKKNLKYLSQTISKIESKQKIEYNAKIEKLIKLFLRDGRSGMLASNAVYSRRSGFYNNQNNGFMNDGFMNNNFVNVNTYNPVMGKQVGELIMLADLFQKINWERLFNLYNSTVSSTNSGYSSFN